MPRFEKLKPPAEYDLVAKTIAEFKKRPKIKGERSFWARMPADLRMSWRVTNRFLNGLDGIRRFEHFADLVTYHDTYHRLWDCSYNSKLLTLTAPWKVMCDKLRKAKQRPLPEYKLRELERSAARRRRNRKAKKKTA